MWTGTVGTYAAVVWHRVVWHRCKKFRGQLLVTTNFQRGGIDICLPEKVDNESSLHLCICCRKKKLNDCCPAKSGAQSTKDLFSLKWSPRLCLLFKMAPKEGDR